MKPYLSFFVNQHGKSSEVFLMQLVDKLAADKHIEIVSLSATQASSDGKISVKSVTKPLSFAFLLSLPGLLMRLKSTNIKLAYRLFVIENAGADKLYFPFISMLREFEPVLQVSKKKIYTSIRGTDITVTPVQQPEIISVYKKLAGRISSMHYLSEELQQRTHAQQLSFGREKVIYQGVDFQKFKFNANLPTDKLRMITVGRFHFIKGLEFLLQTCAYLKHEGTDFHLTLVAEGSDQDKFAYLIHYLDLQDHVSLVGKKSHTELQELYQQHNVYVHTHLVTGISNTMLEALSSNLRVVTFQSNLHLYARSKVAEVIEQVPVVDVVALKDSLASISKNKRYGNDRTKVVEALQAFSIDAHVAGFKDFFELA